jgi:hypothetical protein
VASRGHRACELTAFEAPVADQQSPRARNLRMARLTAYRIGVVPTPELRRFGRGQGALRVLLLARVARLRPAHQGRWQLAILAVSPSSAMTTSQRGASPGFDGSNVGSCARYSTARRRVDSCDARCRAARSHRPRKRATRPPATAIRAGAGHRAHHRSGHRTDVGMVRFYGYADHERTGKLAGLRASLSVARRSRQRAHDHRPTPRRRHTDRRRRRRPARHPLGTRTRPIGGRRTPRQPRCHTAALTTQPSLEMTGAAISNELSSTSCS